MKECKKADPFEVKSILAEKPRNPLSLDTKCLTCVHNGAERKQLYDRFKIACLQYRSSPIQLQPTMTMSRMEAL